MSGFGDRLQDPHGDDVRTGEDGSGPAGTREEFLRALVTQPQPGVWVFDFGQNFTGWPLLELDGPLPAGTTVKLYPAESLNADGTVNQASIMGGGAARGTHAFAAYTTYGDKRELAPAVPLLRDAVGPGDWPARGLRNVIGPWP
ncbi:family 78 glycoside hydrolase catalytic domain [Streptomyces sp. NPDC048825]|uniref:family 78 glycoside hydrolase catalytic domain n=1 Tax=Streptomyces sp. NPDC048825 TaxID=3365592 RepID=UPI0037185363